MFQNAAPALVLLLLMVAAAWFLQRYRRHLPGIASQKGPALQRVRPVAQLQRGPADGLFALQTGEGQPGLIDFHQSAIAAAGDRPRQGQPFKKRCVRQG